MTVAGMGPPPVGASDDGTVRRGLVAAYSPNRESIKNATIMIVDDEPINIKVVRKYLQNAGYQSFVSTSESREAIDLMRIEQPDVVVLDVMMPHISGLEIVEAMRCDPLLQHIPVLILTAASDAQTRLKALELGATDFLGKPVESSELVARIRNMLIVKSHHDHLANYSAKLEHEVRLRTAELASSRQEVIHVLACAAEYRDQETGNHVIRVGRYAAIIAEQLGLDEERVELIEQAAVLHDVGKIGIPDAILLKPGKLDDEELRTMRKHCEFGMNILHGVPSNVNESVRFQASGRRFEPICESPVLQIAAIIAKTHHEKWDGSGYPVGLKGEAIPLEGRITAVADVFDALSSRRPYKPAMPLETCVEILKEGRGSHFDPTILDAFFARINDVIRVSVEYGD